MTFKRLILGIFLVCSLSACGLLYTPTDCEKAGLDSRCNGPVEKKNIKFFANEEDMIGLQNLRTRAIVHCYTTEKVLAETCAQAYEEQGFVRFREIPYKTADYDFLGKDTYPTRRWRHDERTPRW